MKIIKILLLNISLCLLNSCFLGVGIPDFNLQINNESDVSVTIIDLKSDFDGIPFEGEIIIDPHTSFSTKVERKELYEEGIITLKYNNNSVIYNINTGDIIDMTKYTLTLHNNFKFSSNMGDSYQSLQ